VTDLIPALAKALGSSFELSFSKIVNSLYAYLDTENRDINDSI
jgi:DNA-directed RNA polymerase delta subunit